VNVVGFGRNRFLRTPPSQRSIGYSMSGDFFPPWSRSFQFRHPHMKFNSLVLLKDQNVVQRKYCQGSMCVRARVCVCVCVVCVCVTVCVCVYVCATDIINSSVVCARVFMYECACVCARSVCVCLCVCVCVCVYACLSVMAVAKICLNNVVDNRSGPPY
jgi:hypothetical protein